MAAMDWSRARKEVLPMLGGEERRCLPAALILPAVLHERPERPDRQDEQEGRAAQRGARCSSADTAAIMPTTAATMPTAVNLSSSRGPCSHKGRRIERSSTGPYMAAEMSAGPLAAQGRCRYGRKPDERAHWVNLRRGVAVA